ncbi:hypothetical protein MMAD_35280 [Mycolicibacterium madagascariense]|uniref:SHOCT domain-containing protein n=1 Tax=Mycolicibacterium madagascariense TaxID=212765 RepID=A0A7I7XJA4_9MYCO|nr:SHOCT domain-containing protein [Mycolicibacterium madagascariense]MCV7014604.1 SHOCT domain-containing protein [Mycolicibacterium madagascariense]BBZ29233.1 hypothetical protein MMAD_35280 [Mycolicibacterium madagascariense]
MKTPTATRILTTAAVVTMVVSAVGFVAMLSLNAFVLDDYAKYGEVPIPGSASVQLPAGDVTVTFHTMLVGGGGGGGLPVPPLTYSITGPGGADVVLREDYGGTTTVNNDARVRIGYLHLPAAGTYDVKLDGKVSAYVEPRLAFGTGSAFSSLPWICAVVFGCALVGLIVVRVVAARTRRRAVTPPPPPTSTWIPRSVPTESPQQSASFSPSDEGIRVQTLETLARLHDSGALTDDEYEAEKKRVLDGR